MSEGYPPLIRLYLRACLIEAARPVVLRFDRDGRLVETTGELAWYGLDGADAADATANLRDLFLGVGDNDVQVFPQVELPNGRSVHLHRVPDGGGYWVILLDASTDVARQRAVQQLGNEAELSGQEKSRALRRLKKVQGELEQQRSALEQSNALKTGLMATLSHDFRTPLTAVLGYVHLLERRVGAEPGAAKALRAIKRAAIQLGALAENLLVYASDGEGAPIELRPIDPRALAEEVRELYEPLTAERGLGFGVTGTLSAEGLPASDWIKLRQIIGNLVGNAIKFTRAGRIDVALDWDGQRIAIAVRDTGPGIAPEQQARVFEAFARLEGTSAPGAGLGLAIVRRLAQRLGGDVSLESRVGEGSCFRVEVPSMSDRLRPSASAPGAATEVVAGTRALVADDDPDLRDLLKLVLEEAGYEVETASSANDALDRATARPPDLLVIDVQMPGLSGNTAVYRLRAQGYTGRIVTLSGSVVGDAREAALRAGADAFLLKPVDLEMLLRAAAGDRDG
ncbi:MAG: response regulator [Xanthomonadales bacterium]|nr:response regulator [Xanthomonadales bacterium]MBP8177057.1 response regulator [Xanthomonadales bacterium]